MRHAPRTIFLTATLIAVPSVPTTVLAAPNGADGRPATAADSARIARIEADLARVQQDVREQRQLIFQLMQMHDALLKYLQMGGVPGGASSGFAMPPSADGTSGSQPPPKNAESSPPPPSAAPIARGAISGKVRSSAASLGEAYVYLDGPKVMAARSATIEIKQLGRQFVPAVSVVQVGTRILFPNEDRILHNVFSRTPGAAFDLGGVEAGDHRPSPVILLKPGHVEVFCNIHSRMRADILVVPNGYWTRVRPDGSFQLSGVPVGTHRVALWGPTIKPVSQRVELISGVANTVFSTDAVAARPHLNKQGGAYESYEE